MQLSSTHWTYGTVSLHNMSFSSFIPIITIYRPQSVIITLTTWSSNPPQSNNLFVAVAVYMTINRQTFQKRCIYVIVSVWFDVTGCFPAAAHHRAPSGSCCCQKMKVDHHASMWEALLIDIFKIIFVFNTTEGKQLYDSQAVRCSYRLQLWDEISCSRALKRRTSNIHDSSYICHGIITSDKNFLLLTVRLLTPPSGKRHPFTLSNGNNTWHKSNDIAN